MSNIVFQLIDFHFGALTSRSWNFENQDIKSVTVPTKLNVNNESYCP